MNNMRHMDYIKKVTDEDIDCLRQKEATYKGSWKSQGGKNAWAMIRRKIDRLMIMLGDPTPPAHFNLANVNDTIEAVIHNRVLPGTTQVTAEILGYLRDSFTAGDIFAKIEEDTTGADGTALAEIRDLRRYLILVEAEIMSRAATAPSFPPLAIKRPDVDGSQHASEFPWRLNKRQYDAIYARAPNEAAAFWTKRGEEHWMVDVYANTFNGKMPRELNGLFLPSKAGGWIIDISKVPETIRTIFPSLHIERNMFEHSQLPEWQRLLYHLVNEKMVLKEIAWHVDNV